MSLPKNLPMFSRVDSNRTVVSKLLLPLFTLARLIPNAGHRALCFPARFDDCQLRIQEIRNHVRFKGNRCTECVMTMNNHQQDCIVVWQIRHRKVPALASPTLNANLSPAWSGVEEIHTCFVRHRFLHQLLTSVTIDIEWLVIWIRIAHTEPMFQTPSFGSPGRTATLRGSSPGTQLGPERYPRLVFRMLRIQPPLHTCSHALSS